jgi:hypothetical protein
MRYLFQKLHHDTFRSRPLSEYTYNQSTTGHFHTRIQSGSFSLENVCLSYVQSSTNHTQPPWFFTNASANVFQPHSVAFYVEMTVRVMRVCHHFFSYKKKKRKLIWTKCFLSSNFLAQRICTLLTSNREAHETWKRGYRNRWIWR